MTSIGSHCFRPQSLVNLWSPDFMPGDLTKACRVHIDPSDPYDQHWTAAHESRAWLSSPLNSLAQSAGAVEYTECHLSQRGKTLPLTSVLDYDTKQSDGEVPAVLELWRMRSTPSLPSLPGPLWPGVVAPDKVLSMGLNRTKQHTYAKMNWVNWIAWNRNVFDN